MNKNVLNKIQKLKKVTDCIVREYSPEKIILFGSHAWGKPTKDSDIDLFVIKKTKKKRIAREVELRKKLLGNQFPALDLLIYTPEEVKKRVEIEDFFINSILKEGRILYG